MDLDPLELTLKLSHFVCFLNVSIKHFLVCKFKILMLVNMFNNILTINLLKTELFREIGPLYGATFMHEAVIIVSMGGCPCQNNPPGFAHN